MFLESYSAGPVATNIILLACEKTKKAAIIDAPMEGGELVLKRVEELGFEVVMLIMTHSHWDHIIDAHLLKEKTGAPLYIHERDKENLLKPGSDGLPLPLPIEGVEADHLMKEGDVLKVGELELEVIETPGHTPGGVCLYLPKEGTLISGDTLFQGSIGRLDLPTAEPDKMWTSLGKLAKLPLDTRVIPGHGSETTIGSESWLADAKTYFGG